MSAPHTHGGTDAPECTTCTTSVPGAVGAGSAVKALAKVGVTGWDLMPTMPPGGQDSAWWYDYLRRFDHEWRARLSQAIAQDADRTSRGGALTEDEQDRLGREFWRVYDLWRQGEVITDEFVAEMIAATNRILAARAARATRPAPEPFVHRADATPADTRPRCAVWEYAGHAGPCRPAPDDQAEGEALVWECGPHTNAWGGHDARCRQVPAAARAAQPDADGAK